MATAAAAEGGAISQVWWNEALVQAAGEVWQHHQRLAAQQQRLAASSPLDVVVPAIMSLQQEPSAKPDLYLDSMLVADVKQSEIRWLRYDQEEGQIRKEVSEMVWSTLMEDVALELEELLAC